MGFIPTPEQRAILQHDRHRPARARAGPGTGKRATLARRAGIGAPDVKRLLDEMAAGWESLRPDRDPRVDQIQRARFEGVRDEHRRVFGYTLLQELPYALRGALQAHPELEGLDYDLL